MTTMTTKISKMIQMNLTISKRSWTSLKKTKRKEICLMKKVKRMMKTIRTSTLILMMIWSFMIAILMKLTSWSIWRLLMRLCISISKTIISSWWLLVIRGSWMSFWRLWLVLKIWRKEKLLALRGWKSLHSNKLPQWKKKKKKAFSDIECELILFYKKGRKKKPKIYLSGYSYVFNHYHITCN